jgi:group I intron endonuclease
MVIYKITNKLNGKIYIGKSVNNNSDYFGSGVSITQALKKYGKDFFEKEILECCNSIEELNEQEKFWIKKHNSTNKNLGYNVSEGGDGGNTRQGFSKSEIDDYKNKMSYSMLNSEKYLEFVKKIKGKKRPEHSKKLKQLYESGKMRPWNKGIKTSDETKLKISEKNKGKKLSDDAKKKISESKKIKVLMLSKEGDLIRSFDSIKDASEIMRINRCCISDCINSRQKSAGGYKWEINNNVNEKYKKTK